MDEEAWEVVGAPMLLDNNGDVTFIYTPPSLRSRSVSKARDPLHAARMYAKAMQDTTGRWQTFHFTSHDNPYISKDALTDITQDMTALAYRQEIMAEDIDEAPGALFKRSDIEKGRVAKLPETIDSCVVGVDPTASSTGDEAGIITVAKAKNEWYIIKDVSRQGSPQQWATASVDEYLRMEAGWLVAEKNNGGEMVESVIKQVNPSVRVKLVSATRGKATRAEPVAALYEQGRVHHVGSFPKLEDEMSMWQPGDPSPNRMDALVWGVTFLSNPSGFGFGVA
jgi:phage terminase large subunit-like protein